MPSFDNSLIYGGSPRCHNEISLQWPVYQIPKFIFSENKPKKELIQMLVRRGYDSDPVKAWKASQDKLRVGS